MRVAITGGTGMIGTALAEALRSRGDEVRIVTRGQPRTAEHVRWDPAKGVFDEHGLEGVNAVVNLAGAPIADRPWTRARREVLRQSRVDSTQLLIAGLARLPQPPKVFVGCGGLGRFGNRGDVVLDDDAPVGAGFLAELALAWENAHLEAAKIGARTAVMRMSIVLSPTGGAFPLMIKPFRLGIGGWLGDGLQYTPWVTLRDAVAGFLFAIDNPGCEGCFNLTIPEPPTNYDWVKSLGRALHRPVLTRAPKWVLRGAFGELADDLLLASVRAVPRKLLDAGFAFQDTESEAAFAWLVAEFDKIKAKG